MSFKEIFKKRFENAWLGFLIMGLFIYYQNPSHRETFLRLIGIVTKTTAVVVSYGFVPTQDVVPMPPYGNNAMPVMRYYLKVKAENGTTYTLYPSPYNSPSMGQTVAILFKDGQPYLSH